MSTRACIVSATLCTATITPGAAAQLSASVRLWEGNILQSPGQNSHAFTYDCQFPMWPGSEVPVIGGFNWQLSGNTNGNFSISAKAEFATTPEKLAQNAAQHGINQILPSLPCTFGIEENLGVLRGSFNLYSFSIGGGFTGGFEVKRKARGELNFVDYLDITSSISTTIEMPMHVSGSVYGAEGFGDPERTKATARLRLSGSLGQEGFIEQVEVESVSVMPEEASINVTRFVTVHLQPGTTSVAIVVNGEAEVEATAVSAGLFGSISGAATAAVDFPDSIRVRPFQAVGGGPIPEGITVRSRSLGKIIQSTAPAPCYANCDASTGTPALTANDFQCFLNSFAAGEAYANCDASTGSPALTANDFQCFLNKFATGCS
ncbi:MAG: hypothetical protein KF678_04330 [Phycisphaeraceae bacterium]|nr:hypothetical protein [Phycisphaeraceae bacterium]